MSMRRFAFILVALWAAAPVAVRAGELVVNGGFETGSFGASWVNGAYRGAVYNSTYADHLVTLDLPYSGNYSALLGFKYATQRAGTYGYMYQDVTIPSGISRAELNFKVRMQGYDSDFYDPFYADIRTTGNTLLRRVLSYAFSEWNDKYKDSGWMSDDNVAPVGTDVTAYAGQTIRLYFEQANLFDDLYETWTYIDDVSLVYRKWVDLAVDGDGSDVFGTLGSGNGGQSAKSAVAGDTLTYSLVVENEGTVADAYQLTAALPAGWTARIKVGAAYQTFPFTTPTLAAGATATYTVAVVSPGAAAAGTYDTIIDAVSTAQSSRLDSARLRASITAAVHGADLVVDGNGVGVIGDNGAGGFGLKTSVWGTQITFAVEVRNSGNAATTYAMSFASAAGLVTSVVYNGTTYNGAFTTASVPAGGTAAMTLRLQVNSPNPGGDYAVILTGAATADPNRRDSVKATLRLLEPRVDMIIATSGDNVYGASGTGDGGGSSTAGGRGTTVQFPIIVQNESALADSFTMSWTAPAAGWTATLTIGGVNRAFPTVTPTIAPFSQASYTLNVTIPAGAAYGTYRSVLNAASRVASTITESVSATVSVATPSEIDMLVDGQGANVYGPIGTGLGGTAIHTVTPGSTTVFQVQIQNVAGTNRFDVSWTAPSGWTVTFNGSSVPLTNLAAGTYAFSVTVPAGSSGGTFNLIVDGRKNDKPFFMDSITARVVVIPPPIVDALIDGQGDGVFGAVGSGAGGSSLQTSPSPATLNFTVELQNQGPSGDRYRVQWNTIPGWTGRFEAQASPYVTSVIPSGGSRLYTFSVTIPANETVQSYVYILDVTSENNPTSFESVAARVNVVGPPRPDLVIDGNGAGVFGAVGTGQGGSSTRAAAAGNTYTAVLRVLNAGSFPDSMRVQWTVPPGWPANSIAIGDSTATHTTPFWTPVLNPSGFHDYVVTVQVPAGANAAYTAIIDSWSSRPPNLAESVALVTETRGILRGIVFDDRDHNGVFGAGDIGLSNVQVEHVGGLSVVTAADGTFSFQLAAGGVRLTEHDLPGFVSLSPDTVGPFSVAGGDTIDVAFADIGDLALSPGSTRTGAPGMFVTFAHSIQAGTRGHVDVNATADTSLALAWFFDANGNGVFDGGDRPLLPTDGDLDPDVAGGVLNVLLRVSATATPGSTWPVAVVAIQSVTGTGLTLSKSTSDAIFIDDGSAGPLTMEKSSDRSTALPGETVTYSVRVFNAGTSSLRNVVVVDPISSWVDLDPDAFGPGRDVEWSPPAGPAVYLTFDPSDADECEYDGTGRTLRLILSKTTVFNLAPGEAGVLRYRVRIH